MSNLKGKTAVAMNNIKNALLPGNTIKKHTDDDVLFYKKSNLLGEVSKGKNTACKIDIQCGTMSKLVEEVKDHILNGKQTIAQALITEIQNITGITNNANADENSQQTNPQPKPTNKIIIQHINTHFNLFKKKINNNIYNFKTPYDVTIDLSSSLKNQVAKITNINITNNTMTVEYNSNTGALRKLIIPVKSLCVKKDYTISAATDNQPSTFACTQ